MFHYPLKDSPFCNAKLYWQRLLPRSIHGWSNVYNAEESNQVNSGYSKKLFVVWGSYNNKEFCGGIRENLPIKLLWLYVYSERNYGLLVLTRYKEAEYKHWNALGDISKLANKNKEV